MVRLVLVLVCLSGCLSEVSADPWDTYRSVCQIDVQKGSRTWQGSGTLVALNGEYGLILSCRHVNTVEGMPVTVSWYGAGNIKTAGVVHYSMPGKTFSTDLATVIAKVPSGIRPVPIAKFDTVSGPWYSVGYRGNVFLESIASRGSYVEPNLLYLNAPYLGGMSGGATFNRRGELVGVIVASDRFTLGVSTDGPALHDMLRAYMK